MARWDDDPVGSVQRSPDGAASRSVAAVLGSAGLLVLVAGTFLPWLRSGTAIRNSYQAAGIGRRLSLLGDGMWGALATAWPAVSVAAAVSAALYVLGARRSAAVTALALAVVAGTVATVAMVVLPGSESIVRVMTVGPTVTLAGAILAVMGALALLAWPRTDGERGRAGGAR